MPRTNDKIPTRSDKKSKQYREANKALEALIEHVRHKTDPKTHVRASGKVEFRVRLAMLEGMLRTGTEAVQAQPSKQTARRPRRATALPEGDLSAQMKKHVARLREVLATPHRTRRADRPPSGGRGLASSGAPKPLVSKTALYKKAKKQHLRKRGA